MHIDAEGVRRGHGPAFPSALRAVRDAVLLVGCQFREGARLAVGHEHRVIAVAQRAARRPGERAMRAAFEDALLAIGPDDAQRAGEIGAALVRAWWRPWPAAFPRPGAWRGSSRGPAPPSRRCRRRARHPAPRRRGRNHPTRRSARCLHGGERLDAGIAGEGVSVSQAPAGRVPATASRHRASSAANSSSLPLLWVAITIFGWQRAHRRSPTGPSENSTNSGGSRK